MILANCTTVASHERAITKINEITSLDSQGSRKRKSHTMRFKIQGPIKSTPVKNKITWIKTCPSVDKLTTPVKTTLLTMAKIINPSTSSIIAAPIMVLDSRVRNFFISFKTRAVIPTLVADKVDDKKKSVLNNA